MIRISLLILYQTLYQILSAEFVIRTSESIKKSILRFKVLAIDIEVKRFLFNPLKF